MLGTLHGYILRELLKTFGLAAAALTGLFTMAGALYNVVRYEGLTASDVFNILPFLLPGAVAIALPVGALFAGTIVYGRLAADNELTACRAAGINIYRLFLAVLLLALSVTLATTLLVNYVMPDFVKRVERYARANIGQFTYQQFRSRGYIRFDKKKPHEYLVTCEDVATVPDRLLVDHGFEKSEPGLSYFWIDQPRLLVQEGEQVSRFATAAGGLVQFDSRTDPVKFAITLADGQSLEFGRRSIKFDEQKVAIELNIQVPLKPWLVDLTTLLRWRAQPWDGSELERDVRGFIRFLTVDGIAHTLVARLGEGRAAAFRDDRGAEYAVSAATAAIEERRVTMLDVELAVKPERGAARHFLAPKATISVQEASAIGIGSNAAPEEGRLPTLLLRLQETPQKPIVELLGTGRQQTRHTRKESDAAFDSIQIPQDVLASTANITPERVMTEGAALPVSSDAAPRLAEMLKRVEQFKRKVNATMHVRLALSASALVIVVMGALLGVRLSCIPAACVIVLICITGYPMAQRAATAEMGINVIWGSLGGLAIFDLLLLRLGIPR
ncbi:MAG: LptF/LptG family permease [Planctomycetes bacterium]|nr:LptF/LptG family permease [Planctomycetota bacterium]